MPFIEYFLGIRHWFLCCVFVIYTTKAQFNLTEDHRTQVSSFSPTVVGTKNEAELCQEEQCRSVYKVLWEVNNALLGMQETPVFIRVPIAGTEPHDKLWRRGISSAYIMVYITIHHPRKSGQRLNQAEQKPGGWNWCRGHGKVLLTDLPLVACSVCFLILPRTRAQGWHCSQWAGPSPSQIHH